MTTAAKKERRPRRSAASEPTVVYRGIKIAPIAGKRSDTAEALRDALRAKSEQTRDRSA